MQCDFPEWKPKPRGQPSGIAGAGWQALDGDCGHGAVVRSSEDCRSIA